VRGIAVDVGRSIVEKLTGAVPDAAKMRAAVTATFRAGPLMHLFADPEFWVLLAVAIFAAIVEAGAPLHDRHARREARCRIRGELEGAANCARTPSSCLRNIRQAA